MSDSLIYRKLVLEDKEKLEWFYYYNFLGHEPLTIMMGLKIPEDLRSYVEIVMNRVFADDLSFAAVVSGKIVAIRVCLIHSKEHPLNFDFAQTEENKKLIVFGKALGRLYEGIELFDQFNTDVLVACKGLAVDLAYRNRGIGLKLMQITLAECERRGFKAIYVEITSNFSRAIFDRLKFERLCEIAYSELTVDGERVVTDRSIGIHKTMTLHGVKL